MTEIPQSSDELELGHHIVYYTFWPMLVIVFGTVVASVPLWALDYLTIKIALILPWISVSLAALYISVLGDHVIPAETYRKLRSGEWNNETTSTN